MKIIKRKQDQNQGKVLSDLQRRQNDLWESFWGDEWPSIFDDYQTGGKFAPTVDIKETKKEFKVKVDLPNVNPEKVNVEIDGNTLILSGETEQETKEENENYHRMERVSGSFYRSFDLPNTADLEKISCKSRNGVLTISIPKKPESSGRKIKVEMV